MMIVSILESCNSKKITETKMINIVHERGPRNNPLTKKQKKSNTKKSKIRCRGEHVFGFIKNIMSDLYVRSIGIRRATTSVGLINLVYNIFRVDQISRITLSK